MGDRPGQLGIHERPVLIGLHGGPGIDGTKHRYTLGSLADTAQVIVPTNVVTAAAIAATPNTGISRPGRQT